MHNVGEICAERRLTCADRRLPDGSPQTRHDAHDPLRLLDTQRLACRLWVGEFGELVQVLGRRQCDLIHCTLKFWSALIMSRRVGPSSRWRVN